MGTLALRGAKFEFAGHALDVVTLGESSEVPSVDSTVQSPAETTRSMPSSVMSMKPRPPKAGNRKKILAVPSAKVAPLTDTSVPIGDQTAPNHTQGMKGQDDFRSMLLEKKST